MSDNIVTKIKYLRVSPIKMRLVADQIRHLNVEQALQVLSQLSNKSSLLLTKAVKSATANFQQKKALSNKHLKFVTLEINNGPKLKRYQPRAKGVSYPIHKPTSHIRIILSSIAEEGK